MDGGSRRLLIAVRAGLLFQGNSHDIDQVGGPVLKIKISNTKEEAMYNKILVPVALDHSGDISKAMKVANKLLSDNGKIIMLTVVETIPMYVSQQMPVAIIEDNMKEAKTALDAEAGGAKNVKTDVIKGHAANSILEYADEKGCDCIVVASHRPGLQDYFLGSTAARVVRHAQMPVHVVR
jgi:nucleotide-binding universal stress UspA family protein